MVTRYTEPAQRDPLTDKAYTLLGIDPDLHASVIGRAKYLDAYTKNQVLLRRAVSDGGDPDTLTVELVNGHLQFTMRKRET